MASSERVARAEAPDPAAAPEDGAPGRLAGERAG